MEHSAITLPQAQQLIRVIELCGCVPLVRVYANDPVIIKRVMDAGAYGVIIPMVITSEEAESAVNAVKYPPMGKIGVGLARAQGYGFDFEGYKNWVNNESVVIVQIEHIQAVNNLEEILTTPGVDGFIIGPYDLSASIGFPGEFEHPEYIEALNKISKVSKQLQKPAGYHVVQPITEEIFLKIDEGYKFLAFSLDTLFLGKACQNGLNDIKKYLSQRKDIKE
jgi:2-dehydro-3-deoxyglucarate aldolase